MPIADASAPRADAAAAPPHQGAFLVAYGGAILLAWSGAAVTAQRTSWLNNSARGGATANYGGALGLFGGSLDLQPGTVLQGNLVLGGAQTAMGGAPSVLLSQRELLCKPAILLGPEPGLAVAASQARCTRCSPRCA